MACNIQTSTTKVLEGSSSVFRTVWYDIRYHGYLLSPKIKLGSATNEWKARYGTLKPLKSGHNVNNINKPVSFEGFF